MHRVYIGTLAAMTSAIIITLCVLLLVAYVFDLTAARTRIPAVILLLLLGWVARQIAAHASVEVPDLSVVVPVFGTIGLILIVLEGALELELNRSKIPLIGKTLLGALAPLLIMALAMAWLLQRQGPYSLQAALANAIPLCVISSAIAIPSARNLAATQREFVVYESSLSDILGVLCFNFVTLNAVFDLSAVGHFGLQLALMVILSIAATAILALLLGRITHHIKHVPIILLVILFYVIAKAFHLPSLLFILIFGLILGNIDELPAWRWLRALRPEQLTTEVERFQELAVEATFVVRALFFIVFGYLIETAELLNTSTLLWAVGITAGIFGLRVVQLWLSRVPVAPLVFIAPRGLITILLFLSVDPALHIPLINKPLITQVIVLTALIMMVGLMLTGNRRAGAAEASAASAAPLAPPPPDTIAA